MKEKLPAIIIFVIVIAVSILFYSSYINRNDDADESLLQDAQLSEIQEPATRQPPNGYAEFRTKLYNFSIFYPKGMSIKGFDDGGGTHTVTFEDEELGLGFQIFIVPYNEETITPERFNKDIPSSVQEDLRDGEVAGAPAAFFYSENIFLGETIEIWFIKNNFLYEITTVRGLEPLVMKMLESWQFLEQF